MNIRTDVLEPEESVVVLLDEETLDASNAKTFKEQIQPLLSDYRTVLLDMSQLNFVDSSGLGALLSCLRAMNNKDGHLKLYAMNKPVQALFELVRMHRIFSIYGNRDEAVATL
jgi:anti-sigma B factor antagonist